MRDVERWHEWTPSVTSIRVLGPAGLAPGSLAIVRQPKLPPARWKITQLDDARRFFAWVSWAPGVLVTARHGVEATATGSRATLAISYSGVFAGLLARLTRGVNDRYLAMEAEGLKWRSEEPQRLDAAGRAAYALP